MHGNVNGTTMKEKPKNFRNVVVYVPRMTCRPLKLKMAAKLALLVPLALALFSHFVAAQTGKSFDKFLKSDHTNNWAVLVRTKST